MPVRLPLRIFCLTYFMTAHSQYLHSPALIFFFIKEFTVNCHCLFSHPSPSQANSSLRSEHICFLSTWHIGNWTTHVWMNEQMNERGKIKQEQKQLIVWDLEGSQNAKMKEKVRWGCEKQEGCGCQLRAQLWAHIKFSINNAYRPQDESTAETLQRILILGDREGKKAGELPGTSK